jgi:2-C-methyl-D-erythritol 4-phosphate cytidylyltransferase
MVAVVLGGGMGTRFGSSVPKQLLTLAGKTLVEHCVGAFADAPDIDEIVLVMPPDYHQEAREIVGDRVSAILEGGVTRSDSVRNALAYLTARYPEAQTGVLFHDAARPLVTQQIIKDCAAALEKVIASVPPREALYRAQTPQGFRLDTIARAHALAAADPAFIPTDDCGVVLRYLPDVPVHIVAGSERNIKVTYPSDLPVAEALLRT